MSKIIIEVSGGVVQAVNSDDPHIEVEVLDWDNWREERGLSMKLMERMEEEYKQLEYNIY